MNWHSIPLRNVLQISKGYVTILDKELYRYAALQPYPNGLSQKGQKKGTEFRAKRQKTVHAGQFVISKTRVQQRFWGLVQPELEGALVHHSSLCFDIHPDLNTNYFAAYLATSVFRRAVLSACTKQGRLDVRRFGRILIPLPPLDDQLRIAMTWEFAYKALRCTTEMHSSIVELKTGVATDLFQKLTLSSQRRPLGRSVLMGDDRSTDYALYITKAGKCLRVRPDADEDAVGMMPDAEIDHHFLQYYLENQKKAWYSNTTHALSNLTTTLQALEIPLPSLYEQRKLVSVLQQHDDVLQKLKLEQSELRHLIQSLMQQIFSGHLPPFEAISLLQTL